MVAQIVSSKIADFISQRLLQVRADAWELTQLLVDQLARGMDSDEAFGAAAPKLLSLTSSTAVVVKMGEKLIVLGAAPAPATITATLRRVEQQAIPTVWKSDCLRDCLSLADTDPAAAGAIAAPFSAGFVDGLIWFRPAETQEIKWGGKPKDKDARELSVMDRLTPRGSFAKWTEEVLGQSRPWTEGDVECAQYLLTGFAQGILTKALALAYKEMERVVEAKDTFIGTISHELRTPLSIIIGWISILRDFPQADAGAIKAIDIIDRNAKIQIALINDLLDVSRVVSGKLRMESQPGLNLALIASDVVDGLRLVAAAKQIRVKWDSSSNGYVTGDPGRLRQIIFNLVNNAIKFTPKAGEVSVVLKTLGSTVRLEVSDSGMGIDPKQLESVFQTFVQENDPSAKNSGLGLGLSIVKALVELHGGTVKAFSLGRNQGSLFTVELPTYVMPLVENGPHPLSLSTKTRSEKFKAMRILAAEDQPDALQALGILLERHGARVRLAADGREALAILKQEPFDLIISDIGMPEMNGNELLKAWRSEEHLRHAKPVPAIALTAYAQPKDRAKALASGFQTHIPKPVDSEELMAVIDSLGIAWPRNLGAPIEPTPSPLQ